MALRMSSVSKRKFIQASTCSNAGVTFFCLSRRDLRGGVDDGVFSWSEKIEFIPNCYTINN